MTIRRMTRLTNAFSKKLDNDRAAVSLGIAYYNFCRIHQSLRVTPAMESRDNRSRANHRRTYLVDSST
jgi:transposase InsO family protein